MKTEDVYEGKDKEMFSKDSGIFDFSRNYAESKYYDDSNKLVDGKMKYEIVVSLLRNLLD